MKILYKFTKRLPETAHVRQKENIVLECMINDPRAHAKWFRNDEPLEVSWQERFQKQCIESLPINIVFDYPKYVLSREYM